MRKKTLNCIKNQNCDFLIQLKHNRRKLWETIYLNTALSSPLSTYQTYTTKRKEEIYQTTEVYKNNFELPKGWNHINLIVKNRYTFIAKNGIITENVSFHVCSLAELSAQNAAKATRKHWCIENNLHWVKDANIGEDNMTISKNFNAATLLAYFNNIVINLFANANYKPTKYNFAKFTNNVQLMCNELNLITKK